MSLLKNRLLFAFTFFLLPALVFGSMSMMNGHMSKSQMMMKMMKMMPKGEKGVWTGIVAGNLCGLASMECPPFEVKVETPVLFPTKNGNIDMHQCYYFAALPRYQQSELFFKKVKVMGTLYTNHDTIMVQKIWIKKGGSWKPFWHMMM